MISAVAWQAAGTARAAAGGAGRDAAWTHAFQRGPGWQHPLLRLWLLRLRLLRAAGAGAAAAEEGRAAAGGWCWDGSCGRRRTASSTACDVKFSEGMSCSPEGRKAEAVS